MDRYEHRISAFCLCQFATTTNHCISAAAHYSAAAAAAPPLFSSFIYAIELLLNMYVCGNMDPSSNTCNDDYAGV